MSPAPSATPGLPDPAARAPTALEAFLASPNGWTSQVELRKAVCRAVEAGQWDAEIAQSKARPGRGLIETLVLSPVKNGRRYVRWMAAALLGRDAPPPDSELARQLQTIDPMLSAFLACHEQNPALLADRRAVEDLWLACRGPEAVVGKVSQWLSRNGWDWDTPLMGSRVLDLALAMSQGWLTTPRKDEGRATARVNRQRDWLALANKVEPRFSTPLSKALLWAGAPLVLQQAFGTVGSSGDAVVERRVLLAADALAPPESMAGTLEVLCAQSNPFIRAWLAQALPGLLVQPFAIHLRARDALSRKQAEEAVEKLLEKSQASKKRPTLAQQEAVKKKASRLPASVVEDASDLPPGLSPSGAWKLMLQALEATSFRLLPGAPKKAYASDGLDMPSPAQALRQLHANAGPCPDGVLPGRDRRRCVGWWAMLCAQMVSPRSTKMEDVEDLPAAVDRLKQLAIDAQDGSIEQGKALAYQEVQEALETMEISFHRSGAFRMGQSPPPDPTPGMRSLFLELSLEDPSAESRAARPARL